MAKLPRPDGHHTITPSFVVPDAAKVLTFLERAFGGKVVDRYDGPDGSVAHAEIRIGDSVVMLTGESDLARVPGDGPGTAIMATYWEDVDAAWERAVAAGAEVLFPLEDQFYGERGGRVRDPFGHHWMLSQVIEDVSHEEMERRAQELFS